MNEIEKAIDELKYRKGWIHPCCTEWHKAQDLAITALEAQKADMWIPVTVRLPECEEEVEVTIERRREGETYTFTCRAIYEDGNMYDEESGYTWNEFDNAEYDEERDDYKVPQGWYESVYYAEEFSSIDDFVIVWKPITKPWKEEN